MQELGRVGSDDGRGVPPHHPRAQALKQETEGSHFQQGRITQRNEEPHPHQGHGDCRTHRKLRKS